MKRAMSGVKIKTPFIWNGSPDLDVFDQWTYEVDTWRELHGLSDRLMIKLVVQFMSGKASQFFMRHVATRQSDWTLKLLYEALFDYCFPTDFKARLRQQLETLQQDKSRVRDFLRELEHLAVRFPDVTDQQLTRIFWKGLHKYLRVHLIEKGFDPESTKLARLVKHAARRERAYHEARKEEREFEGEVPGRSWGRFSNRARDPTPYKPPSGQPQKPSKLGNNSSQQTRPHNHSPRGQNPSRSQPPRAERRDRLPREELDRLRAEGRCFTCRETGHESRNCKARKTAPAPKGQPGIHAASVHFANLEKLAAQVRPDNITGIHACSVHIDVQTTPADGSEGVWARAHADDCTEYLRSLFVSYYDPQEALDAGMCPDERFVVLPFGDQDFEVRDQLAPHGLPDEYIVTRSQLDDEAIGVPEILQAEWDSWITIPPRPEWGTGFPPSEAPAHMHPALYWLRAHVAAQLREDYPDLPGRDELVRIELHDQGYEVSSKHEDYTYLFTHEEVCDPSFDPRAISRLVLDEWTADELWHEWRLQERRRRRRLRLMACAVRPGRPKGKQGQKAKQNVPANAIPALERNAMRPKDPSRVIPVPLIVEVMINGHKARALLDTGCMADFLSTTLADQLKVHTTVLESAIPVNLAVQGSRSKINRTALVDLEYQSIACKRQFDVVNLENYDVILGTPFFFQHRVAIGLNPSRVSIGSDTPLRIEGENTSVVLSAAATLLEGELDNLREMLRQEAADLCQDGARAALPPLRDINHTIPIIDETLVYPWRPSKCPDALKPLWREKLHAYTESGRWQMASGTNASPMLMLPKPARDDGLDISIAV